MSRGTQRNVEVSLRPVRSYFMFLRKRGPVSQRLGLTYIHGVIMRSFSSLRTMEPRSV